MDDRCGPPRNRLNEPVLAGQAALQTVAEMNTNHHFIAKTYAMLFRKLTIKSVNAHWLATIAQEARI